MIRTLSNFINLNIAMQIDEIARKESPSMYGQCVDVLINSTLADKISWSFFKFILFNPIVVFVVVIILYIIFFIVFLPLYLISYIISSWGSFLVFIWLICLLARLIARTMSFPGSTKSLQRDYSVDFMKRFLIQLENTAAMASNFTCTLMLVASGQIPRVEIQLLAQKLQEVKYHTDLLPRYVSI